jgi:hypothetical protein
MTTDKDPVLPGSIAKALETMPPEIGRLGVERFRRFIEHNRSDIHWFYAALDNDDFARPLLRLWSTSKFVLKAASIIPECLRI